MPVLHFTDKQKEAIAERVAKGQAFYDTMELGKQKYKTAIEIHTHHYMVNGLAPIEPEWVLNLKQLEKYAYRCRFNSQAEKYLKLCNTVLILTIRATKSKEN